MTDTPLPQSPLSTAQSHPGHAISNREYAQRRKTLAAGLPAEAAALIPGGDEPHGSERFRQVNEFHYFCGVEEPHAYLMIASDGRTTLFLAKRRYTRFVPEEAEWVMAQTGVEAVLPLDELPRHLAPLPCVLVPHQGGEGPRISRDTYQAWERSVAADPLDDRPGRNRAILGSIRSKWPEKELRDLTPLIDEMRLIKSPAELALMRRSGELTGLGTLAAMRITRPGCFEYDLHAELEHVYIHGGARGSGYAPIIPGSANAGDPHYLANDCRLEEGDIVLLDCAPDYHYYTSDIGRMWPVNGRFSQGQRALYGFVLAYHKVLLELVRPGAFRDEVHQTAAERMRPVFEKWTFETPAQRDTASILFDFTGHISHGVGMPVHDVSQHYQRAFEPGMVFAVDPMAWDYKNDTFYRVEDTVAVTETGCENLTACCPIEVEDIEAVVGSRQG